MSLANKIHLQIKVSDDSVLKVAKSLIYSMKKIGQSLVAQLKGHQSMKIKLHKVLFFVSYLERMMSSNLRTSYMLSI